MRRAAVSGHDDGQVDAGDTVARNATFSFVTQMTTAAFTAGVTLFLGRVLEPAGYGHFALALSIGAIAFFLADLGLSASAARFVAEVRGDRMASRRVIADALRLKIVLSAVVCGLLFALAAPIAGALHAPSAVWPLRGIAIAVFGQGLVLFFMNTFAALGRIGVSLRVVALESLFEAAAIITLVLLGTGAAGAAFGRSFGYAIGGGLALAAAVRLLGTLRHDRRTIGRTSVRQVAGYAGALLIIEGLFRLFTEIDAILIAAVLGGGAPVGLFQLPMKLAWFLHYPLGAVAAAIAPRLARRGDAGPQVTMFMTALRLTIVLQGMFVAPIIMWSEPIVRVVLGSGYAESADVLRALAPFVLLAGPAILVTLGLNYLGEARRRVPLAIAALVLNIAVDIALLSHLGIVAAAIGTNAAYALWVPGHLLILRSQLGISLRLPVMWFMKALVAIGAACLPLAVVAGESVGAAGLVAGTAVSAVVYVSALVVLRGLNRDDARLLAGFVRPRSR